MLTEDRPCSPRLRRLLLGVHFSPQGRQLNPRCLPGVKAQRRQWLTESRLLTTGGPEVWKTQGSAEHLP